MAQINLNVTDNLELPKEGMVGIGFDTAKKLTAKDDEGNTWEIGGGGGGLVNVTYDELLTKVNNGELEPGTNYLITDFRTVHHILDNNTSRTGDINTGELEPLIVKAVNTNELDKEAISTIYPKDVIYYSITSDIRDIAFYNDNQSPVTGYKGQIYFRHDTIQNVSTWYDFRNVKFRRWAVDAELYEDGVDGAYATYTGQVSGMTTDVTLTADTIGVIGNTIMLKGDGVQNIEVLVKKWNESNYSNIVKVTAGDWSQIPDAGTYITLDGGVDGSTVGTAYVKNDVCKSGVDGKIYKCIADTTGEGDPTVNTTDWVLWLDITADAFVSWTADKTAFKIGGDINTDNLIINDYDDFYTFGDYYNWVKNVSIGMIDLEYVIEELGYATQLNNIVFKTVDEFYTCFGNNIGSNCCNNTIGNYFNDNTIGNMFILNTIGDSFQDNTIGSFFNSNTIGNNFQDNTIGNNFNSNTIGDNFNSNNIENNFESNAIGKYFKSNTIGNNFSYNTIGNSFNSNTIGNRFNSNTIGNNFSYNTIGDYFSKNTIGDGFGSNAIENNFNTNTIGDGFGSNAIENNFNTNTIGNEFSSNTIGDGFNNNAIGNYFHFNTIGNKFNTNAIGDNFRSNTIGDDFKSNTIVYDFNNNAIGNEFYSNTIGNKFNTNAIGDNFRSNTIGDDNNAIGNYFHFNTIGNNFRSNTIGNAFNNNTIANNFTSNTIGHSFRNNTIGNSLYNIIFGDNCQDNTIANKINEDKKIITFGDSITMCTIQDYAFRLLAEDLDLTAATHIRRAYNTTIYQDKTDGVKLSYMDGGVMQIVDVTA